MRHFAMYAFLIIGILGCGITPRKVSSDSSELIPLKEAMKSSRRISLGFTEVSPTSDIRLETATDRNYDVMLHIYGKTSRTIAFHKQASGYVWIGEQEIYTGPRTYDAADGRQNEEVVITYDVVKLSGYPTSQLNVVYHGPAQAWK